MRTRLVLLGFALLLAALAWLLVRAHESGSGVDATLAGGLAPGAQGAPVDAEAGSSARAAAGARQPTAQELRFEALPEEPSELVVHLVDDATKHPVLGAEIWALDVDSYEWWQKGGPEGGPQPDGESLLRARGKRFESDEHGDLRLPIPRACLALCARKDELYGEATVSFESLPEETLHLVRTGNCRIRARDDAGRPVAGAEIVLGSGHSNEIWRARTDAAGEVVVPNIACVIAARAGHPADWYVAVDEAALEPVLRWFTSDVPIPPTIDLVLAGAQSLHLRVCASDGTPVPVHGAVEPQPQVAAGHSAALHLPRRSYPQLPLVRGEARVPRVEPGAWVLLQVYLAGGQDFDSEVRVPPLGEAPGELLLRMPEKLQVVLARVTDETGAPLASSELEWVSFATEEKDDLEMDQRLDKLRTDEQGQLALVLAREDLQRAEDVDDPEQHPRRAWRGFLRLHAAGRELVSEPILFASIVAGAVRDLGLVKLSPAIPLVRGHVRDDRGRPLAHVRVGLEQARNEEGEHSFEDMAGVESDSGTRTDAEGAFVLHGTCPGGTMHVNLAREGYLPPRDTPQGEFECGSSPDLALLMVRVGALRTSIRAAHGFNGTLTWVLDDGRPESVENQVQLGAGAGPFEHTVENLLPGTYRVRLMDLDSEAAPFVDVEGVVIRPGQSTLDPRLLELELRTTPGNAALPEVRRADITLRVIDEAGNPISDGQVSTHYADMGGGWEWHGGRVRIPGGERESRITIWSPGFQAFSGECPDVSGDLRLERAALLRMRVEIPARLRKPERHFRLWAHVESADEGLFEIASTLAPVELEPDGLASFESPGKLEFSFDVEWTDLDPSGQSTREGTRWRSLVCFSDSVSADGELHSLSLGAEAWASIEKDILGGH